jgi:hypothetical protein
LWVFEMTRINEIYGLLVRKHRENYGSTSGLANRINKLTNEGKTWEEAVVIFTLELGLKIPEIERLVGKGMSHNEAISEFSQNLAREEQIQDIYSKSEPSKPSRVREEKAWRIVAKYFIHGIVFSLLFTVLVIAWTLGLLMLVVLGALVGLAIGVAVLILIVGFLNAVITAQLWFKIKTGFWDLLLHGLVLFIVLLIVNGIFVMGPRFVFPGISTTIITFVIGSFLDGLVGKRIAGWWKEEHREGISAVIEAEWRDKKL